MKQQLMVSREKILIHNNRVAKFLRGETIYPVTLELGITANCNRNCPDCPSSSGQRTLTLDLKLIYKLFDFLSQKTKGIIITGGEPTLHPEFPQILKSAREYGFEDIAVVTNGHLLDKKDVFEALTDYASAVRISLYDWDGSDLTGLTPTLHRIDRLKERIIQTGSPLKIGVSALTHKENVSILPSVIQKSRESGADWIYFHPTCTRDITGAPQRMEQQMVLKKIRECASSSSGDFPIHFLDKRYESLDITFSGYHTAHFVLVVGADAKNYLATEAKYREEYSLWDLKNNWDETFLEDQERIRSIASISDEKFPPQESRNRGVLYNLLIQEIINQKRTIPDSPAWGTFALPHII